MHMKFIFFFFFWGGLMINSDFNLLSRIFRNLQQFSSMTGYRYVRNNTLYLITWVLHIKLKHPVILNKAPLFFFTSNRTNQLFWLNMLCHLPLQALARYCCWYGLAFNLSFAVSTGNQDLMRSVSKQRILLFDKLST